MAKRVTLAKVTARASVLPIKVSRALRRPDTVQPETRTRIDAAVAMLSYVPDPAAREPAMGRSDVIGVLIPSAPIAVFTDVLSGIYGRLAESRVDVQYGITRYDPAMRKTCSACSCASDLPGSSSQSLTRPRRHGGF